MDFETDNDAFDHEILYPTVAEVNQIHDDIIEDDENADAGVLSEGDIDYALNFVEHGVMGEVPETIHEKAFELLRLLAANHAYADGNKRTALNTTWTFYALNGYYFDYGEEIKAVLKLIAVMERMVDADEVIDYFEDITYDEDNEHAPTALVKYTHLTRWYANLGERAQRVIDEADSTDPNVGIQLGNLIAENYGLVLELIDLRDNYADQIPDEFIEVINESEDSLHESLQFLNQYLGERETVFDEKVGEAIEEVGDQHPNADVDELEDEIDFEGMLQLLNVMDEELYNRSSRASENEE